MVSGCCWSTVPLTRTGLTSGLAAMSNWYATLPTGPSVAAFATASTGRSSRGTLGKIPKGWGVGARSSMVVRVGDCAQLPARTPTFIVAVSVNHTDALRHLGLCQARGVATCRLYLQI